jgi:fimbrial isopeptide formation D2 family protein
LTVTSLTDSGGRVVDLTVAGARGQAPGQTVPLTASKTWLRYRVLLSANATNLTGVAHTFTATVQQTDMADADAEWTAVPDGTTLTATPSGSGILDPASQCLTAGTNGGTCQFIVHDNGPGTLTLDVTAISTTVIDGVPFSDIPLSVPAIASKTWLAYTVTVSPSATNLAGTPHDFAITATMTDGETSTPATNASMAFTWSGTESSTPASTCTTDSAGTCTVTVTSSTAGSGTLTVASLTDNAGRLVDLTTAGAPGQAQGQVVPLTATKTWVFANLVVHKTANGATPVAGGDPFNYTITVTNEGALATSAPVTMTDTIGPGLEFAGTPSMPVSAGSCAPPSGSTMTCTITTSLAVGDTVTIVVPARVAAGTVGPVENVVTADSREDPLCPNGTCPPPPECAAPATPATQTVAVLASTTAADPSDNQACVLSSVTAAGGTVVPPPVARSPLARTGPDDLSALLGALLLLSGVGLVVVTRRRARSPA